MTNLGFQAIGGRPEDAPKLHNIRVSMDEYQNGGHIEEWEMIRIFVQKKTQRMLEEQEADIYT